MWVASPWGFSEMTIQPARHECLAFCLLRARFLAFQPVVDNTRGTHVEQTESSFQKTLRGLQLTWYFGLFWVYIAWMEIRISDFPHDDLNCIFILNLFWYLHVSQYYHGETIPKKFKLVAFLAREYPCFLPSDSIFQSQSRGHSARREFL